MSTVDLDWLPSEGAIVRELVRRQGLRSFVREFWDVLEPAAPFVDGWVIGAVCEHLEAVTSRQIRNLVINVPPGTGKSSLVCVAWPSWVWTTDPKHRWIFASHDYQLVLRDSNRMLRVLGSDLYQEAWPDFKLGTDPKAAGQFENLHGGRRFGTSIGGKGVGWHADTQVCDDPHKPKDSMNRDALVKVSEWWSGTMATRRANPETFARVVIMQRIAEDDLSGVLLTEQGYEHLCLPMHYAPNAVWDLGSSLGRVDPRTEPGELLWPERFSEQSVKDLEAELKTPQNRSAQLEQNPIPDAGGIIEKAWLARTWEILPRGIRLVQSWDLGFKGANASHSRVAGMLWGELNGIFYAVDLVAGIWNYPESRRQFAAAQKRELWDKAAIKLIEAKANGIAIIAELSEGIDYTDPVTGKTSKMFVDGVKEVSPVDDKATRLIAHTDLFEAGRVLLPVSAPWVAEYRAELVSFPRGAKDDLVDVTSQALDHLNGAVSRYAEALRKLKQ